MREPIQKAVFLGILFLFSAACFPGTAFSGQNHYVFPDNIALTLEEKSSGKSDGAELTGTIQSHLGTLKNLEIFFNSSPDLKVECDTRQIPEVAEQKPQKVTLIVIRTKGKPDEMGTWVRMGVKYAPDYDHILKTVSNTASYPVDFERQRLIDAATGNRKRAEKYTDAVRIFLSKPKGGKP